ncbi:MAG: hypothetical protein ACXABM_07835 [Candidatus Thorarchaeota archaeon]
MRLRVIAVSLALVITLPAMLPAVSADFWITLDMNEVSLNPTMLGNSTEHQDQDMKELSLSSDGTMFTVSHNTNWEIIRGQTPVSLIAWANNGSILWSRQYGSFDRILYDVTNDGTYVYVTGQQDDNVYVGKFDFDGQLEWNTTYNLGHAERGYKVLILGDGTIVIGGVRWTDSDPAVFDYFILALNQTGYIQWSDNLFEMTPSLSCDSDYLYVSTDFIAQKRSANGTIVWSNDGGMVGGISCLSNDKMYTILHATPSLTELIIKTLSLESGEVLDSFSMYLILDEMHTHFTCWGAVGNPNGPLNLLVSPTLINRWYLLTIDQTELTYFRLILEGAWSHVQFDKDDTGDVYLACNSEEYCLTVMRFDSAHLTSWSPTVVTTTTTTTTENMNDFQAVVIAIVGVVSFNVVLIIYLKRKYHL